MDYGYLANGVKKRWPDEVSFEEAEAMFPESTVWLDWAVPHILNSSNHVLRAITSWNKKYTHVLHIMAPAIDPWLTWMRTRTLQCTIRRRMRNDRKPKEPAFYNKSGDWDRIMSLQYTMSARWIPEVRVWRRFTLSMPTKPRRKLRLFDHEEKALAMFIDTESFKTPLESPDAWRVAEERFPECSAAWDRDKGPDWVKGRANMLVLVTNDGVMVGCGEEAPFGWALWMPAREVNGHKVEGFWLFM